MSRRTDRSMSPPVYQGSWCTKQPGSWCTKDHGVPSQFAPQNRDRRDLSDSHINGERSSISRTHKDNDADFQPRDVHRSPNKNQRSSLARNREDDDAEYQVRDSHRSADTIPRSSISRRDEDHDAEYRPRDVDQGLNRNQRPSVAKNREDNDQGYQSRDPHRNADRNLRPSIARSREDDDDDVECQPRDVHQNPNKTQRSSFAHNKGDDDRQCRPRDPHQNADKSPRSSIARSREDDDDAECQPRDVHQNPNKTQRSSFAHNQGDDAGEYRPRDPHRNADKSPRSSIARSREIDDAECQPRDEHRSPIKNQRSSLARSHEDDEPRDLHRDSCRSQRSSVDRMRDAEEPAKPRQNKSLRDSHHDAAVGYSQPKGLPKHKDRRDSEDNIDRRCRPSVPNQRPVENEVEDSDDDRRQPARHSPQTKRNSHSPRQNVEDRYDQRSPQQGEGDDFENDYSDGETEVQSEDGTWRPITEDDLKGLRSGQQDDADECGDDSDRPQRKSNRCPADRSQTYEDDDRVRKPQENMTRHDDRDVRNHVETKNQEMNVSLTPRGQHDAPKPGSKVHSKTVVLDCQHDQDDIGALKWGFNEDGAYLKRVPYPLAVKFGLETYDVLLKINDKNVCRKSKKEIETCWMDCQEDDEVLRLVLEGEI